MLFKKKNVVLLVNLAAFIARNLVAVAAPAPSTLFENFETFPTGYLGCQNSDPSKCPGGVDPVTTNSYCSGGSGFPLAGCQQSANCDWCTFNEFTDNINNPKRQLDANIVPTPAGPVGFGAKCLQISNAVWAGSFGAHPFTPSLPNAAGESDAYNLKTTSGVSFSRTRTASADWNRHFQASFDFVSLEPNAQQPNLRLEIAPTCGDSVRMGQVLITDENDGLKVTYTGTTMESGNVVFVTDLIASGLDRALTYTLTITMTFVDGEDNDVVVVELVKKHGSRRRRLEQSEETLHQVKGRGVRQLLEKKQSHREMKGQKKKKKKSKSPSKKPLKKPSRKPTRKPSRKPSITPSLAPSSKPSLAPSSKPSLAPSSKPSLAPSSKPSLAPSSKPSLAPSSKPSLKPSKKPSRVIFTKTLKSWENYYYHNEAISTSPDVFKSRPVDSLMFRVATAAFFSCGLSTNSWTCTTFPGYSPLLGKGFCIDNVSWQTY